MEWIAKWMAVFVEEKVDLELWLDILEAKYNENPEAALTTIRISVVSPEGYAEVTGESPYGHF